MSFAADTLEEMFDSGDWFEIVEQYMSSRDDLLASPSPPESASETRQRVTCEVMALSHNGYQVLEPTGTYRLSADAIPVCPKSSPFQSSGSRVSNASA